MKDKTDKYGLGGLIGTGLGIAVGTPLGNPMLGAQLGGMAGNMVEGAVSKPKGQPSGNSLQYTPSSYGYMYGGVPTYELAYGGTKPKTKKMGKGGAVRFKGPSHEKGGVKLSKNVEVEGGETMDKIGKKDYIFSRRLTVPGSNMNFADMHASLVAGKASKKDIANLAFMQEKVAGRL